MSKCDIPGCPNEAVAGGLCAKHYMRQRRHGDPNAPNPPGRPPSPRPADPELDALRRDNAALREQVAALLKAASRDEAVSDAKKTLKRLGALAHENETLKAKLAKAKASPDERIAELERQLKAARTRNNNLRAEAMLAGHAARANPTVITKSGLNAIRKALHPDRENDASAHRKAELNAGLAAFNAVKFSVKPE